MGRTGRALLLLAAGVLVFCDDAGVSLAGTAGVVAALLAIGFVERRWRAVAWAAMVLVSAFLGDVLWQTGWDPYDRSADYEALPQTPFVVLALPVPMAIVAVGVAAGRLGHRLRRRP
jgi:hypothetical protein